MQIEILPVYRGMRALMTAGLLETVRVVSELFYDFFVFSCVSHSVIYFSHTLPLVDCWGLFVLIVCGSQKIRHIKNNFRHLIVCHYSRYINITGI